MVAANPSEKWWSSSVGMMKFPIYGKIKAMFQTTNQILTLIHIYILYMCVCVNYINRRWLKRYTVNWWTKTYQTWGYDPLAQEWLPTLQAYRQFYHFTNVFEMSSLHKMSKLRPHLYIAHSTCFTILPMSSRCLPFIKCPSSGPIYISHTAHGMTLKPQWQSLHRVILKSMDSWIENLVLHSETQTIE